MKTMVFISLHYFRVNYNEKIKIVWKDYGIHITVTISLDLDGLLKFATHRFS
jgi:hypothetical protein